MTTDDQAFPSAFDPAGPLMSTGKDDWRTPPKILEAVRNVAPIELDPCAGVGTKIGERNWTEKGTVRPWTSPSIVFVNPPYSQMKEWATKMVLESLEDVSIICLTPCRSDTVAWQKLARVARATCFLKGRLKYIDPERPDLKNAAPFPSTVMLLGNGYFPKFIQAFDALGVIGGHAW